MGREGTLNLNLHDRNLNLKFHFMILQMITEIESDLLLRNIGISLTQADKTISCQ